MDDFSTPGTPNAFGLWPSPCKLHHTYPATIVSRIKPTGNYPEPYKRPLSSTVPTILERQVRNSDGNLEWNFYLAAGGSGGSKIFPAVAQVLLGIDTWGLDVSSAIEAGRVHDQLFPTMVEVDSTVDTEIVDTLRVKGHNATGE